MPAYLAPRFIRNGDIHIAYQVMGAGPIDLVVVPGFMSHLELQWELDPQYRAWVRRLASFSRLILFDNRGSGLSDRDVGDSDLDERVDDLRLVLDGVGSMRCAVLGMATGGALAIRFAQRHPERTSSLILCSGFAGAQASEPAGVVLPLDRMEALTDTAWGLGKLLGMLAPSQKTNPQAMARAGRLERASLSPRGARAVFAQARRLDTATSAHALRLPTMVIHRSNDAVVPVEFGRWLGQHIDNATYVERLAEDHLPWEGSSAEEDLDEIQQFLTGSKPDQDSDRFLATVFFSDIVNSTGLLARQGDRLWGETLARYYEIMRETIKRFGGREIDTSGDGFFVTFSLPARAVRCAAAACQALHALGIDIRVGLHTGECQRQGGSVVGIAVHTAARIMAMAQPGDVMVSRTLTDLVAGSGLVFKDTGIHALRNVPGEWRLFRVDQDQVLAPPATVAAPALMMAAA